MADADRYYPNFCLTSEDGDWWCPKGGPISRSEFIGQLAEDFCVSIAEIEETVTDCFMAPITDDAHRTDEITHAVCEPTSEGAEPYWWYQA